jgi:hypothetical protein
VERESVTGAPGLKCYLGSAHTDEALTASDARVLLGDALVLLDDEVLTGGDARVLLGDELLTGGDALVLLGDALVLLGDEALTGGDAALTAGGVSCGAIPTSPQGRAGLSCRTRSIVNIQTRRESGPGSGCSRRHERIATRQRVGLDGITSTKRCCKGPCARPGSLRV